MMTKVKLKVETELARGVERLNEDQPAAAERLLRRLLRQCGTLVLQRGSQINNGHVPDEVHREKARQIAKNLESRSVPKETRAD